MKKIEKIILLLGVFLCSLVMISCANAAGGDYSSADLPESSGADPLLKHGSWIINYDDFWIEGDGFNTYEVIDDKLYLYTHSSSAHIKNEIIENGETWIFAKGWYSYKFKDIMEVTFSYSYRETSPGKGYLYLSKDTLDVWYFKEESLKSNKEIEVKCFSQTDNIPQIRIYSYETVDGSISFKQIAQDDIETADIYNSGVLLTYSNENEEKIVLNMAEKGYETNSLCVAIDGNTMYYAESNMYASVYDNSAYDNYVDKIKDGISVTYEMGGKKEKNSNVNVMYDKSACIVEYSLSNIVAKKESDTLMYYECDLTIDSHNYINKNILNHMDVSAILGKTYRLKGECNYSDRW